MDDQNDLHPLQLKELPSTLRRRPPLNPAVIREMDEERAEESRKARNTWYWVWYECLRLSEDYQRCCKNNGKGRLRHVYQDFGDVCRKPFPIWWRSTGRYLFAEQKSVPVVQCYTKSHEMDDIGSLRGKILIEVPLNLRKATAVRQINKILKTAYEGREVIPREQSTARRRLVKSKLRLPTAKMMLRLYDLRQRKPELTLWQLGEAGGVELNLYARTQEPVILSVQEERTRMNIAVSRYLRQARELITNATEGVCPSIKPFAQQALSADDAVESVPNGTTQEDDTSE